jgi:alkanesulfonate monooxygenase SsuD/methylene tetrahydromethanopterin reductase-like flavin-dependent oxidoreductase (luciferase family)
MGRRPDAAKSAVGIGCVIADDETKLREKMRRFKPISISKKDYTTKQMRLEGTPDRCIDMLKVYADLGVTRFVMNFPDIATTEPIRLFGEKIIPAFR